MKKRQGRPPVIENARNRILDEAAALFARSGYERSSVEEVANAIGATKAAVYHYFDSKQDIYDAIIVRTLMGLAAHVRSAVGESGTAHEKLRRYMTAHAAYLEEHYSDFAAMLVGFSGMEHPGMKREAQRLRAEHEGRLRNIVKQGVGEGTFRQIEAASTARAVLSLLSWMVRWFKPGGGRSAASFAEEYFDLLIGGIGR